MSRRGALVAVAAAVVAAVAPMAHAADSTSTATTGTFTKASYASAFGSRDYWLYVPSVAAQAPRPLVVYLHGCNETADQTASASHFNTLAEQNNFVVAYPQQAVTPGTSAPFADGNGIGCWNWFLDQDQHRGAGEPALLAGLTQSLVQDQSLDIDASRVYVEGVSAGADMSVVLAATYPDVYAGAAAIAGCAYATCSDESGLLAYREMAERARVVPLFVENGSADTLNNLALAQGLVDGWLGTDDLADDGTMNGSVSRTPASVTNNDVDQTPQPGSGDLCIHNNSLTCPGGAIGFQGNYPSTVQAFDTANGCEVLEYWVLHGMEHAHPDAPGDGPYTDPLGPDISAKSWDFFSHHTLTAAGDASGGCVA